MIATQRYPRIAFACATGIVGLIVAFPMTYWGGPNAGYLPDRGLRPVAFSGAAIAGWLFVSGFGRSGIRAG